MAFAMADDTPNACMSLSFQGAVDNFLGALLLESALYSLRQYPQNKICKSGMFFVPLASDFIDHVRAAFHHRFTTKPPQQTHAFSPTPIKKAPVKPGKKGSTGASEFFLKSAAVFSIADKRSKPAHNTDRDSHRAEVAADNAAAPAALVGHQHPTGSTPPGIPS